MRLLKMAPPDPAEAVGRPRSSRTRPAWTIDTEPQRGRLSTAANRGKSRFGIAGCGRALRCDKPQQGALGGPAGGDSLSERSWLISPTALRLRPGPPGRKKADAGNGQLDLGVAAADPDLDRHRVPARPAVATGSGGGSARVEVDPAVDIGPTGGGPDSP